jgi:pimeloyl-ACP methyl ester carboxylesterase
MATFVLVPGGGHGPWCWERLVPELEALGHEVVTPDVPADVPDATLDDYVSMVASSVPEADDLVVVGHSMAGAYLPLVADRVGADRQVFLCAYVPTEGASVFPPGTDTVVGVELDEQGRIPMHTYGPEGVQQALAGDCDLETAAWAAARIRPQGMALMTEPFPVDGWPRSVRSAFISCAEDPIQPAEATESIASERFGVEAVILPGSHSPFLSRPADLAATLDDLLSDESRWG